MKKLVGSLEETLSWKQTGALADQSASAAAIVAAFERSPAGKSNIV